MHNRLRCDFGQLRPQMLLSILLSMSVSIFYCNFSCGQINDPNWPPPTTDPIPGDAGHSDVLLEAFFGETFAADQRPPIPVPKEYEHAEDYSYYANKPGSTLPAIPDREFGAFVTANSNDSNGNDVVDYMENSILPTDPDLILIVINRPSGWVQGLSDGSVQTFGATSYNVRYWDDNQRSNEISPDTTYFNSVFATESKAEIWVELTNYSSEISDKTLSFVHLKGEKDEPGAVREFDRISLTALWSFGYGRVESQEYNVTKVVGNNLHISGATQPVKDDWIVVRNTNHEEDMQHLYALLKVVGDPQNTNQPTTKIVPVNKLDPESLTLLDIDAWVDHQDTFTEGLNREIDNLFLHATFIHYGGIIGATPHGPFNPIGNGIEFRFEYKPSGILRKKLSHGQYVVVDVTRSAEGRSKVTEEFMGEYNTLPPAGPDFPPDDLEDVNDDPDIWIYDEDNIDVADSIFSYDCPGTPADPNAVPGFTIPQLVILDFRANFYEFSRLSFVSPAPEENMKWGTRSSRFIRWRTGSSVWRRRWDGLWEDQPDAPVLQEQGPNNTEVDVPNNSIKVDSHLTEDCILFLNEDDE